MQPLLLHQRHPRRMIDAKKNYVVSGTLEHADWNAELVRGDLELVDRVEYASGAVALRREPKARR